MKVLTLIVSFNGARWLHKCLTALMQQDGEVSVMVIDNHSTDQSQQILSEFAGKIRLIHLPENIGFGQACNIGLRAALAENFDYAFLLNQDATVEANTISTLVNIATRYQVDVLSPLHYNGQGTALDPLFSSCLDARATPAILQDLARGEVSEVYPTRFVNAAAWLVSRHALQTVGGFDPMFFHYGEDNDYLYRAAFHGLLVAVTPLAKIFHDRPTPPSFLRLPPSRMANAELVQLKNPNRSFPHALLISAARTGYRALREAANLRLRNSIHAIRIFLRVTVRSRAILQNRKLIRTPGPSFLIHAPNRD